MRLKPKHVGDEFVLDEYNACQMLLYNQQFTEPITLNPSTPTKGLFSTYTYIEHPNLTVGKYETLELMTDLTENNKYIEIKLPFYEFNTNSKYYATIYYKDNDQFTTDEGETVTRYATDGQEIRDTIRVSDLNIPRDYKNITVPCEIYKDYQICKLLIPLYITNTKGEKEGITEEHTLIHNKVILNCSFNNKPYIDVANGIANEMDEILIDTTKKLQKLIQYTPTDEPVIYRLDSLCDFEPTTTLTIKKGMDVEIRGGTNQNAEIYGGSCNRVFLVKPGGKLKLKNITLSACDGEYASYKPGLGGAILLEHDDLNYSTLELRNCLIVQCTAKHGSAIYSSYNEVYLDNVEFKDCHSTDNGGAIYYKSDMVQLSMTDYKSKPGKTITLKVNCKHDDGSNIQNGTIAWYIGTTKVGTTAISKGIATCDYAIPSTQYNDILVTAQFIETETLEGNSVQSTIFIEDPTILSFTLPNVVVKILGTNAPLRVTSIDQTGAINTSGTGIFTIDGTDYPAIVQDNQYILDFPIPTTGYKDKYTVTFKTTDVLCTPVTSYITVIGNDLTGLYVEPQTKITETLVNKWIENGITDVFVKCYDINDQTKNINLNTASKIMENKTIRLHASLTAFRDEKDKALAVDDTRTQWIKDQIEKILLTTKVQGINLEQFRYSGWKDGVKYPSSTYVDDINKRITDVINHVNSIQSNIITSMTVMPEFGIINKGDTYNNSKTTKTFADSLVGKTWDEAFYGQNYKTLGGVVDILMPKLYKGDYAVKGTTDRPDSWVQIEAGHLSDAIDAGTLSDDKVWIVLQTYLKDSNKTPRTKANLESTMKSLPAGKFKGVTLYREDLIDEYPNSLKKLRGE